MSEVLEGEFVETSTDLVVQEETQLPIVPQQMPVLTLEKLMEMSTMLAKSTIVPVAYQNRPENCFIALDMANRMGVSPLIVMQNLHVIQGKPSFSGSAIASMIRTNPNLRDVDLVYVGTEGKDDWGAYVTAIRVKDGRKLKGGTVTMSIAKKEGWYQKSGSKWQTMPEIMLAYRAYAWFGRVFIPEAMMGLHSTEEIADTADRIDKTTVVTNPFQKEG